MRLLAGDKPRFAPGGQARRVIAAGRDPMRHWIAWRVSRIPLAAGHQVAAGQRGLEVLIPAVGDADGRAGDVRRSQRPSALLAYRPTRCRDVNGRGKKQAETAGFLAWQGMLHKHPEAARDDQFGRARSSRSGRTHGRPVTEQRAPDSGTRRNHRSPRRNLCARAGFSIAVDMGHS